MDLHMKQSGYQYPLTVKSFVTDITVCHNKSVVCCSLKLTNTSCIIMTSRIGVHRDTDKLLSTYKQAYPMLKRKTRCLSTRYGSYVKVIMMLERVNTAYVNILECNNASM